MTDRGRKPTERDPHPRIDAWLIGGATGELARDLAVHASVCPECQVRIAAFDMLGAVDVERAGFPPLRTPAAVRSSRQGLAVAAGGVLAATAVAVAAAAVWRLVPLPGLVAASDAPTQAVLGNTGQPAVTPDVQASGSPSPTMTPSASQSSSPSPADSAGGTPIPPVVVPPPTPLPTSPPNPTPRPTPTPRPSVSPPTATPAPTPTPLPTPEPPTPTPLPTEPPTPTVAPAP